MSDRGDDSIATAFTDFDLVGKPLLNKGTAFTEEERDVFKLHGLLPPQVGTLDEQISRRLKAIRRLPTDFDRYALLRDLQDTNETLFHALLSRHIVEMLPVVYTPTVGEGCQRFSEIWRKPRGLFLSYPNKDRIARILANPRFDDVRIIVVSDGERILGLGDQGAGGMGIPIGKLSLYTACAGIHPSKTLPILLDVGTDNEARLADPIYIGWRHERVRGAQYDEFIEAFVDAVVARWPNILLQWEDFAGANAGRLLERYRDRLCTFNDDVQGTAAVAAGTLMAAINLTGVPLREQRIALLGAGSAGCGIASLLLQAMVDEGSTLADARARFFAIDKPGLLQEGMPGLHPAQVPFVQPPARVASWTLQDARPHRPRRRHAERPAHHPHRRHRPGRRLHRGSRPHDGEPRRAPGDLSALEPDLAQRGEPEGPARMDRRTRADRHRQPVSGRDADKQLVHLPRRRPRGAGRRGDARHRHDVHGGGEGARGALAGGAGRRHGAPATGRPAAFGGGGDRIGGGAPGTAGRRRAQARHGGAAPAHPRRGVGAGLPPLPAGALSAARKPQALAA